MSLANQDARLLLDLLESMRQFQSSIDLSLERASIAHKIEALLTKPRGEMDGWDLVADMSDDELAWAIANKDQRLKGTGFYGHGMNPFAFNFLRRNRPRVIPLIDKINKVL